MAITNNFVMTIDEVKEISPITRNVNETTLKDSMRYVHRMELQNLLGKSCYDDLVAQVLADTVTAVNQTLLDDYVKDYVAQRMVVHSASKIAKKMTQKGIGRGPSDQNTASADEVRGITADAEFKSLRWKKRLIKYVQDNQTDYPCWDDTDETIEKFRTDGNIGGFVI
jgi:hypothetical protein